MMNYRSVILRPLLSNSRRINPTTNISRAILGRSLWGWLNMAFNKVDYDRINEVGPDRAAAEWLLKNGAHVRFQGFARLQTDYNSIPSMTSKKMKIVEINAVESSIRDIGFEYLKNLTHVETFRMKRCSSINDAAVERLCYLSTSLKRVEIFSCGNVTDKGISSLKCLRLMEKLTLFDLPELKHWEQTRMQLETDLPNCNIKLVPVEDD